MAKRFSDHFSDVEKVEEMFESADRAATSKAERSFIDNLYETFEEYGMATYLSDAQCVWFIKLANK